MGALKKGGLEPPYELWWKNRSIDYSKCEYLPEENSNSNEKMLFLRKTGETIWKPSLS